MLSSLSKPDSQTPLETAWFALVARTPPQVRQFLTDLAQRNAGWMADLFYEGMLLDDQAKVFLSHEVVNGRLREAMRRWCEALFSSWEEREVRELIALQCHVGTVHARVNVRVDLVLRGARRIREGLVELLQAAQIDCAARAAIMDCALGLVDLAMEAMAAQYVNANEVAARTDEAYRAHAANLNMSLERERQRAALLDWESRVLQDLMMGVPTESLARIDISSFGLWVQHKAGAIFPQGTELAAVLEAMSRIDDQLLPLCERASARGDRDELRRLMRQVLEEVGQIRYLKGALFQRMVDLEIGRDVLTQLLNRRFLPAILAREIELSRRASKQFALLMLDVDHFKTINDRSGHDAGDRILQHLAAVMLNCVRSGDFVFRYGGEEFLVVSVELSQVQAVAVAEKIRLAVEQENFLLSNGQTLRATVSIGVAFYDGHPDYQRLLDRADRALYQAKEGGRNRCVVAD